MKSFQEISEVYEISNRLFYRYLQIRHALNTQFRGKVPELSEMPFLKKLVNAETYKGLISEMYENIRGAAQEGEVEHGNKVKWERDVGPITEEQWRQALALGPRSRSRRLYPTYT